MELGQKIKMLRKEKGLHMPEKWSWLAERIKECGYPTRKSFADAIGYQEVRLSEIINRTVVNGGKFRNFPKTKIRQVAELLHLDILRLQAYNNDLIDTIDMEPCNCTCAETTNKNNSEERIKKFFDAVDTIRACMKDADFVLTPEQKLALIGALTKDSRKTI